MEDYNNIFCVFALASINHNNRYRFELIDICDYEGTGSKSKSYQPDAILHFAAETHEYRSISDPKGLIETNILDTFIYFKKLSHIGKV